MKRKLLALVLLLALAASLAPSALAADGCAPGEHDWVKESEKPATCTADGVIIYHCSKCGTKGKVTLSALGHNWQLTSTTATCLKGGIELYTCKRCGGTTRKTAGALGHDYGPEEPDIPPTCLEAGRNVRTCRRDPTHIWYIEVPPLGHDWGDWEMLTTPTTTVPGTEQRVCKRDPSHVEQREIPPVNDGTDELVASIEISGYCDPGPFHVGEKFTVHWAIMNTGDVPLYKGGFAGDADGYGVPTELAVNESYSWTVEHEVTEYYLEQGYHYNIDDECYDPEITYPNSTLPLYAAAHYVSSWEDGNHSCSDAYLQIRYMLPDGEVFVPTPDLSLTADCGPGPFTVDDVISVKYELQNTGNVDLVYTDCTGDAEETYLPAVLTPGEKHSWTVHHTVTEEDLAAGYWIHSTTGETVTEKQPSCSIAFRASASYAYTGDVETSVYVPVERETLLIRKLYGETPAPKPELTVTSVSAESGLGKVKGDQIQATVTIKNTGTVELMFLGVGFDDGSDRIVECDYLHIYNTMAPGEEFNETFRLTVDDPDLSTGFIEGIVFAFGVYEPSTLSVSSNEVPLHIDLDGTPGPIDQPAISLTVTCLSPEPFFFDGSGLTADINYSAKVTNTGKVPVQTGFVRYDGGSGVFDCASATTVVLYPGESMPFYFSYQFQDTAIKSDGKLHIKCQAFFYQEGTLVEVPSNVVELAHAVEEIPPWSVTSFTAEKFVVGSSSDPHGYQSGETVHFVVRVTNTSDVAVDSVTVVDPIFPEEASVTLLNIQPNESRDVDFFYDVPPHDTSYNKLYNHAILNWTDPASGESMSAASNEVSVDLWQPDEKGGLVVEKWHDPEPANGHFFVENEIVHFKVKVENTSDVVLYNVTVFDPLSGIPGDVIAHYEKLAPHESHIIDVPYQVTAYDAGVGLVTNVAFASAIDWYGNAYRVTGSDEVRTGIERKYASLWIFKEEINTPPERSYYYVGETIHYRITIYNDGDIDLTDVQVFDSLSETWTAIGTITQLHVGQTAYFYFDYPTDEWDVPKVYNTATAFYTTPTAIDVPVISNEVISNVLGYPPPVPPEPGEKTSCVTELKGVGDHAAFYILTTCEEHGKVLEQAKALTQSAETAADQAEAWKQAAALWRAATEEMYLTMVSEATGPAGPALVDDRTFFRAYAERYETLLNSLWPDAPEKVYKAVSDLWMIQCTELCYLDANAPALRPDSLVNGRANIGIPVSEHSSMTVLPNTAGTVDIRQFFDAEHSAVWQAVTSQVREAVKRDELTNAFTRSTRAWGASLNKILSARYVNGDETVRNALSLYRPAFTAMVGRRESLMRILYPGMPETVAEVVSNLWRREVMLMSAE